MSIEKVIERYLQLIQTEDFLKYEKNLAQRLQKGLFEGYQQNLHESKMVLDIKAIINKMDGLSQFINNKFHIFTNSIFIHGNKSIVEFEYYGNKTERELGDLIFIISVVYNNKKYFEKLTITQFKKSNKQPIWYFCQGAKEQLYLLTRFPSFKGVRGIIPKKEYNLPNYSKCLGSYGLLYKPGDFVFASAKIVEAVLGNGKSINIKNIGQIFFSNSSFWCDRCRDRYVCFEICRYYFRNSFLLYKFCPNNFLPIIGNSIYSSNVYEFIEKYLRALIGELVFVYDFSYNKPVFQFLQDLMGAIKIKAKRNKDKKNLKFINFFYQYKYGRGGEGDFGDRENFDYEGGGIGIIHTIINLGEG